MSIGSFRNVDGSFPAHLLPDDNLSTVCEYVTQGENNADDRALVLSANVSRGWRDNPALVEARGQAADRIAWRQERVYPGNLVRLFRECGWNIGRAPLEHVGGAPVMRFMDRYGLSCIVIQVEGRSNRPDRRGRPMLGVPGAVRIYPTMLPPGILIIASRNRIPQHIELEGVLRNDLAPESLEQPLHRPEYGLRWAPYPNCPIHMFSLSQVSTIRALTNLLQDLDPLFRLATPIEVARPSTPGNQLFHTLPNYGRIPGAELVFQYLRTDPQMLWHFDETADPAIVQTSAVCRDWQRHPFLEQERERAAPRLVWHRELQIRDEIEQLYPAELCRLSRHHFGRPISAFPQLESGREEYTYDTGITPRDMERSVMRYTTRDGHPSVAFLIEGYGDREIQVWSYLRRGSHPELMEEPEEEQVQATAYEVIREQSVTLREVSRKSEEKDPREESAASEVSSAQRREVTAYDRENEMVYAQQNRAVREIAGVVTAMYARSPSDHHLIVGMSPDTVFRQGVYRHCQLDTGNQKPYQALFDLATGRNPYFRLGSR